MCSNRGAGRWSSLGFLFFGALFLASPAAAAIPIEWDAPEGCPTTDGVLDELRRTLGHEPADLGRVSRVRGVVIADEGASPPRFRLTLEVAYAEQRSARTFEAERCEDLARAAALAIAIAVHAERAGAAPAEGVAEVAPALPEPAASAPSGVDKAAERPRDADRSRGRRALTPCWTWARCSSPRWAWASARARRSPRSS